MELDELKLNWELLSKKVEQQQKLNAKLIEQMTNQRYQSRLNKIAYPEFIGSFICIIAAIGLMFNIDKLNTQLLQVLGGLSALLLVALPVLSLQGVRGLQKIDTNPSSYAGTLKQFAVKQIRFQKLQKLVLWLSIVFMIVFVPVVIKLLALKDITHSTTYWAIILPVCVVLQFLVSRKVLKHYNHALKKAEELLNEVEW